MATFAFISIESYFLEEDEKFCVDKHLIDVSELENLQAAIDHAKKLNINTPSSQSHHIWNMDYLIPDIVAASQARDEDIANLTEA